MPATGDDVCARAGFSLRVFSSGRGSYDVLEPKVRELLKRHSTRQIAARVTLTSQAADVIRIYRHLKNDMGFHEVGFAPVTTSPVRLYAIGSNGLDTVLQQLHGCGMAKHVRRHLLSLQ